MAVLRIELLEDCEMNSGRVVNTYFADDVFFDGFGLPYIPAVVIRNSFAKALEDAQGSFSDSDAELLVGEHARLILDNARIEGWQSMRQAIISNMYGGVLLRNPQTVLNASGFVKIRENSNVAQDHYVRVLKQGDIFEAFVGLDESCAAVFRRLVAATSNIYVGHRVRALFTLDEEWERPQFVPAEAQVDFGGERCRLEYDLHFLSHKTTLNHISGEMEAEPFISGAEVRAALERRADLPGFFEQGGRGIICSYAYIGVRGRRGLPIPASYSTKKQDKADLRDRCSLGRRPDDYDQIKGMGTLFIDDPDSVEVHAMSVREEQAIIHYYADGAFLCAPFNAIGQAQTFKGFIEGPADKVRRIYESLMTDGYLRVGHLSNLGFGSAYAQVTSVKPVEKREPMFVKEITVLLVSPARLYWRGLYEPSAQSVLREVEAALGGAIELEIVRNSQKTCQISTYNKAWRELEPLEYAMQAGSIYRMRAKDGSAFDISSALGGVFIGGHNDIGYGEALVLPAVDAYYRQITYGSQSEGELGLVCKVDPNPGRKLMRTLYQKNANVMAAYMGATTAEDYVRDVFQPGPLGKIRSTIGADFDPAEAFEAYMEALKENGLNKIRRMHRD